MKRCGYSKAVGDMNFHDCKCFLVVLESVLHVVGLEVHASHVVPRHRLVHTVGLHLAHYMKYFNVLRKSPSNVVPLQEDLADVLARHSFTKAVWILVLHDFQRLLEVRKSSFVVAALKKCGSELVQQLCTCFATVVGHRSRLLSCLVCWHLGFLASWLLGFLASWLLVANLKSSALFGPGWTCLVCFTQAQTKAAGTDARKTLALGSNLKYLANVCQVFEIRTTLPTLTWSKTF